MFSKCGDIFPECLKLTTKIVNLSDQGAVEVVEDTAGTSEPAAQQDMTLVEDDEEEEEAEEVVFNEKQGEDVGDDDEGVVSDYESDAEMTEEMFLGKLHVDHL